MPASYRFHGRFITARKYHQLKNLKSASRHIKISPTAIYRYKGKFISKRKYEQIDRRIKNKKPLTKDTSLPKIIWDNVDAESPIDENLFVMISDLNISHYIPQWIPDRHALYVKSLEIVFERYASKHEISEYRQAEKEFLKLSKSYKKKHHILSIKDTIPKHHSGQNLIGYKIYNKPLSRESYTEQGYIKIGEPSSTDNIKRVVSEMFKTHAKRNYIQYYVIAEITTIYGNAIESRTIIPRTGI
jgi:hypothetical protein